MPKFRIYFAVYLILRKGDEILLSKRMNTGFQDGKFSLVAGHVDGNESTKNALIREAKEEANLIIKEEDLKVVHTMHRNSDDREYIDVYLETEKWQNEPQNAEPHKCEELRWCHKDNLPPETLDYIKHALNNIENSIHFSEYGWN